MKKFAHDLAEFLRRHYPEAAKEGCYRFSADLRIVDGEVEVEIPLLSRLPESSKKQPQARLKADPLKAHLPRDNAN